MLGIAPGDGDDLALEKLDAWLCDLKEMQIRDGLHIFGKSPDGGLLTDLTVALARIKRGEGVGEDSLHRAIARDAGLSKKYPSPTRPHRGRGSNPQHMWIPRSLKLVLRPLASPPCGEGLGRDFV